MLSSAPSVNVMFDLAEVDELSIEILQQMEDDDVPVSMACAALSMTLGRLLSPTRPMGDPEAVRFIQAIMEFTGCYFTEGRPN